MLESAQLSELPVIIRFILTLTNVDNAKNIIADLRQNLQSSIESCQNEESKKQEFLILESLNSGLQFRDDICKQFLQIIGNVSKDKILPIDFWILVVILSISRHAKKAERFLRKKIKEGYFTKAILNRALCDHAAALESHFNSLLSISEFSLRSKIDRVSQFGIEIYYILFQNFKEAYQRQEVL